jgi:ankyrin repeat protein
MKALVEYGASIYKSRVDRAISILLAMQEGHLEIVKMLLKRGAATDSSIY